MTASGSIVAVEVHNVVLPLPAPLILGGMTVTRREYTLVRVLADDGTVGTAYCLSREAPMAEIIRRLVAPLIVGASADDTAGAWQRMLRGSAIVGRVGLVRRGIGLVDIALWDLAAKRKGLPVWSIAGRGGAQRPAMIVASYPSKGRTTESVVKEVKRHASAGWRLLKISRVDDTALMFDILQTLQAELPKDAQIVVDAGFGWRDAEHALSETVGWEAFPIAWLEDPVLPEDVPGIGELARRSGLRIGVGDEVTDPYLLERLMAVGITVLRLDVVAIGGITPALEVIANAESAGVRISGHVYPEVTVHLGIEVETFDRGPEGNPYDPSALLMQGGPCVVAGIAVPPSGPGLGFNIAPKYWGES